MNSIPEFYVKLLKLYKLFFHQDVYKLLQTAIAEQWVSEDELASRQIKRLKSLLVHCAHSVPYYKALFREGGINPDDCNDLSFLKKIPLLTKEDVQNHRDALICENEDKKKLFECRTGGSTGKGLVFYLDSYKRASIVAFRLRCDYWTGVPPFSKTARIWAVDSNDGFIQRFSRSTREISSNQRVYDLWRLSQDNVIRYVDSINRWQPQLIVGYSTGLYLLSLLMKKRGLTLKGRPKIISTAEMLTGKIASQIRQSLSPHIFNRYGCREVGPISMTCEWGGQHINSDNIVLEVTDHQGRCLDGGQTGNVVVTDLNNFAMPFVRYAIEDRAALSLQKCKCGRSFPLMSNMVGRTGEFLLGEKGRIVHMSQIVLYMERFDSIHLYQLHQTRDKSIFLNLAFKPGVKRAGTVMKKIVTGLNTIVGPTIPIILNSEDPFVKTEQGKHRYIVSDGSFFQ